MPRYRIQAQEIARQEGLLGSNDSSRKGRGKKISKQEEDAILKQIVEQKLDIKGGYKKPSKSCLFVLLLLTICFFFRPQAHSLGSIISLSI